MIKNAKQVPKQCPNCKMWLFNATNQVQHSRGILCWGNTPINDDATKAIWQYWRDKRKVSIPERQWLLTGGQLLELMEDAGITRDDIGMGNDKYQLGRHNDTGHYEVGNCRFITGLENKRERQVKSTAEMVAQAPHCKEVSTPHGTYPSIGEAARRTGVTRETVKNRVRNEKQKWKEWHLV